MSEAPGWFTAISRILGYAVWLVFALAILIVVWDLVAVVLYPGHTISAIALSDACKGGTGPLASGLIAGLLVGFSGAAPLFYIGGHKYWPQRR